MVNLKRARKWSYSASDGFCDLFAVTQAENARIARFRISNFSVSRILNRGKSNIGVLVRVTMAGMSVYRFERLKILVVDDNVHMRQLITRMLQSLGVMDIYEAESAEHAWEALRKRNPDLIVLDWVMRGMSGLNLVHLIRTDPQSPNPFMPVIMLTGHTSIERIQQARDAGVNEVVAKPVSPTTMKSRLIAILGRPRPYVRTGGYFGPCRRRRRDDKYQGPEHRQSISRDAAE